MEEKDLKQIEAMMTRVLGVFAEDVQHKLDLLSEGQQMLSERMDRLGTRLDERFDGVERRDAGGRGRIVKQVELRCRKINRKINPSPFSAQRQSAAMKIYQDLWLKP